jgi:hypothetical protein
MSVLLFHCFNVSAIISLCIHGYTSQQFTNFPSLVSYLPVTLRPFNKSILCRMRNSVETRRAELSETCSSNCKFRMPAVRSAIRCTHKSDNERRETTFSSGDSTPPHPTLLSSGYIPSVRLPQLVALPGFRFVYKLSHFSFSVEHWRSGGDVCNAGRVEKQAADYNSYNPCSFFP